MLTQIALAKLNESQSRTKNHKTGERTDVYGIGGWQEWKEDEIRRKNNQNIYMYEIVK